MSRHVSELCVLLVDEIYGELTSRVFHVLLRYSRLSLPAIQYHTQLSFRLVKHSLSVLVQQQLVLWYTSPDDRLTVYEANTESAYALLRAGKYVRASDEALGEIAGTIISDLLFAGHARAGDLVKAYGVSRRQLKTRDSTQEQVTPGKNLLNGSSHPKEKVEAPKASRGVIQRTLDKLLQDGLLTLVNESHFRSAADNRLEAQKVVPPVEFYKAKSKREREAQWEYSIKLKLDEWKYGGKRKHDMIKDPNVGEKRAPDNQGGPQAKKRPRLDPSLSRQDSLLTGKVHGPEDEDIYDFDENLILSVNHQKFAVIMRNNSLIDLANQSICASTSDVYAKILRRMEPETVTCQRSPSDEEDSEYELSSFPYVSTDELVAMIGESSDLAKALGDVDISRGDLAEDDHPKKRRRKDLAGENEIMIDGSASSDEDDDESQSEDDHSDIISDSDELNGHAEYNPDPTTSVPHDQHRHTIREHLLLLARHPFGFLHRLPQSPTLPERWTVDFRPLIEKLNHHTLCQIVNSRLGTPATRLVRLLSEKGKVDEKNLCSFSLINQKTMRSYLTALHKTGVIQLQEVPRDGSRNPQRTMFLWYFDLERYKSKVLEETYKSIARCVQRAKVEGEKMKGTVEKANRSDVVGREEQFLSMQELEALRKWKELEERIWGELGRLDELVAIIRDY